MADVASLYFGQPAWQYAGVLLAAGCVFGLLAAAAGLMEITRVPEGRPMDDAMWHMGLMLTAFCVFTGRLFVGFVDKSWVAPNTLAFILDLTGFAFLMLGGFMGGRLVYTHGVGQVQTRPPSR